MHFFKKHNILLKSHYDKPSKLQTYLSFQTVVLAFVVLVLLLPMIFIEFLHFLVYTASDLTKSFASLKWHLFIHNRLEA